jgi:hypothetical protein
MRKTSRNVRFGLWYDFRNPPRRRRCLRALRQGGALLDMSLADGVIALYDSKYTYHRWRPVTAVRAADADGNPDTVGDPNWTPLAVTALDPSYVGSHA